MEHELEKSNGEFIYTLGVKDGCFTGITEEEYKQALNEVEKFCEENNLSFTFVSKQKIQDKFLYDFLIRRNTPGKYIDLKVACTGNVDSGKSSLLGVLLTGENDDGRGKARSGVFNFKHEKRSGRSSSVAHHILGFDREYKIVNSSGKKKWTDIVAKSNKIVTFFDLCGHETYLKTTIMGLTSQFPNLVFILVGANMGINNITKEHLFLCRVLRIPFIIIVTKIDICEDRKDVMKDTVQNIKKILKSRGIKLSPFDIKKEEDIALCIKNMSSSAPIFYVSNVTGQGIPFIQKFLNLYQIEDKEEENENKVELQVEKTFRVPGVGTVIGGQLVKGKISVGDELCVGPNNDKFETIHVKSIHIKRVNVDYADTKCYVCIALRKKTVFPVTRGNIVLSPKDRLYQVREFDAQVSIPKSHSTTVKIGYEPTMHTCSIRQTAKILKISGHETLRTGDKTIVSFRFSYRPEYIKPGFRILLVEGKVKIIGIVTAVKEIKIEI